MRRTLRTSAPVSRAMLAAAILVPTAMSATGCKSLNEAYIRLEVWKYERCFGHPPPGFMPTAAVAPIGAPAMAPCGQPAGAVGAPCAPAAACASAPCQGGVASPVVSEGCSGCNGSGVPGAIVSEGAPSISSPAGVVAPSPTPAAVTSSKPVVISDEVVLP